MVIDVLTRHLPARAAHLARQQASLATLRGPWIQTVLVDPISSGVPASHRRLRTVQPNGDWVWVLDDDDVCLAPDLHDLLAPSADLHIFRMRYAWGQPVPPDDVFAARTIREAAIGAPCAIVTRALWMAARDGWGDRYEGDFDFIVAAAQRARKIRWVDRVIAGIEQIGSGPHGQ